MRECSSGWLPVPRLVLPLCPPSSSYTYIVDTYGTYLLPSPTRPPPPSPPGQGQVRVRLAAKAPLHRTAHKARALAPWLRLMPRALLRLTVVGAAASGFQEPVPAAPICMHLSGRPRLPSLSRLSASCLSACLPVCLPPARPSASILPAKMDPFAVPSRALSTRMRLSTNACYGTAAAQMPNLPMFRFFISVIVSSS